MASFSRLIRSSFFPETGTIYHAITFVITVVNIILLVFLIRSKGLNGYLIGTILGGSLGNLFDRIYYYAVPDFIDFHVGNFHWFIFNIADIFITVGIIGLIFSELIKKEETLTNV